MRRATEALQEWLQLRARVREERLFHRDRSIADFRSEGMTLSAAKRAAKERLGSRRHLRASLQELGCDLTGLARLLRVYRVQASVWFQPAVLLAAMAVILIISPSPHAILEGIGRYRSAIVTGPAKSAWLVLGFCAAFQMRRLRPWPLCYGVLSISLHALASTMAWALALQLWSQVLWSTDGRALLAFLGLLLAYLNMAVLQYRYWWRDLQRRCPVCLDGLLLPLTEGTADRVLLSSATTESVCAHGHGVLVENRWSKRFRPEESSLGKLLRA